MPLYEVHGIEQGAGVETILPIDALSVEDALRRADGLGLQSACVVEPRRCDALDDPNFIPPEQRDGLFASCGHRRMALAAGAMLIMFAAAATATLSLTHAGAGSAPAMLSAILLLTLSIGLKAAIVFARLGR
ncbi:MAG: hypothetical protein IT430_19315 [Phycisphaerales bacterium]|nr:hypothetical protein [Phycisphaerales bacterium]